ncbi:patatin-like phospholipase family protein [Shewanella sp. 202IG2-18]|uniref:patatin-like phospholipase family protein n=1 Tax=Parashewanella hymeniacidonis TaxID=2807618 RepID=UPI0019610799|nr:patatin-like phospholipase family protein [Parashewanella hymeniacidonis]MBM7074302.1 patatin-like phospholipase family protein [Parashewanella hymeniacidonis]
MSSYDNSSTQATEGTPKESDLTSITFRQLFLLRNATNEESPWFSSHSTMKALTIIGTDKELKYEEEFSYGKSPDISIRLAVLASGSAPFLMSDVEIEGRSYIDGGITNNTPHAYLKTSPGLVIQLGASHTPVNELGIKDKLISKCTDFIVGCEASEYENFDSKSASSSQRLKVFNLTPSASTLHINQAVANYYPNLNSAEQQYYEFEAQLLSKLKKTEDSNTESHAESKESPEYYRYRKYARSESYVDEFVNISIKGRDQITEEKLTIKKVLN